jgi:hypothetical protein
MNHAKAKTLLYLNLQSLVQSQLLDIKDLFLIVFDYVYEGPLGPQGYSIPPKIGITLWNFSLTAPLPLPLPPQPLPASAIQGPIGLSQHGERETKRVFLSLWPFLVLCDGVT